MYIHSKIIYILISQKVNQMKSQRLFPITKIVLSVLFLAGVSNYTMATDKTLLTKKKDSKQQKEMVYSLPSVLKGKITTPDTIFPLWIGQKVPSNGITKPLDCPDSKDGIVRLKSIANAAIYVYSPKEVTNTQCCVLICPGGGYGIEAIDHEGVKYAEFLAVHGITGAVLQYRLPNHHKDIPLADAMEAMRTLRSNADKLNINVHKIGVSGFSAGGHLASTLGTQYRKGGENCRPDFMLLMYPVISSDPAITHDGTYNSLLGPDATQAARYKYSNEMNVDAQTPPTFLLLGSEDRAVNPQNSIRFYEALVRNNVRAGIHIFSKGGHGFGMKKTGLNLDRWPEMTVEWLKENEFTNKKP